MTADETTLRQCTKCGETKPLTEYKLRGRGHGDRANQCKTCTNEQQRQYRIANRDKINEYRRANRSHYRANERETNQRYRERKRAERKAYLEAHPEEAAALAAAAQARRRQARRNAKKPESVTNCEKGQLQREKVLAYLRERIATGTMPQRQIDIAIELGITGCRVSYYLGRLFHEGLILSPTRKLNLATIQIADEPAPPLGKPCCRCGILSEHLDRCGYCCLCQYELAYGRPFDYKRELRIRVRVQGMPMPTFEEAIAVDDWPTAGVLAGVEVAW